MREIVKVLLQEGIDESMINRVLDLIEEEYDVVDENDNLRKTISKAEDLLNAKLLKGESIPKKFKKYQNPELALEIPKGMDSKDVKGNEQNPVDLQHFKEKVKNIPSSAEGNEDKHKSKLQKGIQKTADKQENDKKDRAYKHYKRLIDNAKKDKANTLKRAL